MTKLTIKIKKRSQTGWLMWPIIVLPFLLGFLNEFLGLPWALRYLLDAAWFALLLLMLRFSGSIKWKNVQGIIGWVSIFLLYTGAVYLIEYQSVLYYLWGLRNNIRFSIALLAFAAFMSTRDVEDYLKFFDKIFWLNFVISLVQYFGLGFYGDHLGGIFGTESGVNAYTNLYFMITVTKSLLLYLQRREKIYNCASMCMAAMFIAALAELKFFFVEFVVILVLAVLFTDFTWRKFWVIMGGFAAVAGCAALLAVLFPHFAGFFSIEWLYDTAMSDKGYTSAGDLNRLNAIPQINELWLRNWSRRTFGLGLGNCDTSAFAIVNTPFFEANGHMHYTWIGYAFMYLECGWIGLIFYYGFFAMAYLKATKVAKHAQGHEKAYCLLARIMAVCCVMNSVYNASLRTEAGYMAYFVLAIPYVIERENEDRKRRERLAEKYRAEHSLS